MSDIWIGKAGSNKDGDIYRVKWSKDSLYYYDYLIPNPSIKRQLYVLIKDKIYTKAASVAKKNASNVIKRDMKLQPVEDEIDKLIDQVRKKE